MTAEQLEELLGRMNGDEHDVAYAEHVLRSFAPSLARRVLAAEAMAKALEGLIDYCGSSQMGCSTWDEEAALTAYREASK